MLRGITISPSSPGLAVNTKGLMELLLAGARVELTNTVGARVELTNTGGARVELTNAAGAGLENTNIGLGLGLEVLVGDLGGTSSISSCPGGLGGGFRGLGGLAPLTTLTGVLTLPREDSLNSSNPGTVGGLL